MPLPDPPSVQGPTNAALPASRPSPHRVGYFSGLMDYFRRFAHPQAMTVDGDITSEKDPLQDWWQQKFSLSSNRIERYRIFEEMETFGIVQACLSIWSEESTQTDYDRQRSIWIESPHEHMTTAGNECLRNIWAETDIGSLCYNLCMLGDQFRRLVYQTGKGVLAWQYAPSSQVHRVDDKLNRLIGFKEDGKKFRQRQHPTSWPWDYVHFRLLGKDAHTGYGTATLAPLFRSWRQMCLAKGTIIWTTDGPVAIEKVQPGMSVWCHDPHAKKTYRTDVKSVVLMGEQELVRVRTSHRELLVTPNHGLLVREDSGEFLYKKAAELCCTGTGDDRSAYRTDSLVLPCVANGDYEYTVHIDPAKYFIWLNGPAAYEAIGVMDRIRSCGLSVSPKRAHYFLQGKCSLPFADYERMRTVFNLGDVSVYYRKGHKPAPFGTDFKFTVTPKFMRLFGFMLGDGWINGVSVGMAMGVDDAQNKRYIELFQEVFGIKEYVTTEAIEGVRGGAVGFNSHAIADVLHSAGYVSGCAKKRIPAWVYGMSLECRKELLWGILESDGGHAYAEAWRLSMSNQPLMEGILTLAQQVGWGVSRELAEIHREDRQPTWRILINTKESSEEVTYERVISVDRVGVGETFDLEVEDDLHNFVAAGVVSHNTITEDAILIGRLRRAPGRLAYFIQTNSNEDSDAMAIVQAWRKRIRKHEYIDPSTPRYIKQYNAFTPTDDIFLPLRGEQDNTRVEAIQEQNGVDQAYDLQHWVREFCGTARIPPAYLGFDGEINARATLLSQDCRFARMIKSIRRGLIFGYRTTLDIHYHLLDPDKFNIKANPYIVQMAPISYLDEYERLELVQLRFQIIESMAAVGGQLQFDPAVWASYILLNYGKIPEEMVLKLLRNTARMSGMPTGVNGSGEVVDSTIPRSLQQRITETARTMRIDPRTVVSGIGTQGYTSLKEEEKREIHKIMSLCPFIGETVGNLVDYTMDDRAIMQTDPSMYPPTTGGMVMDDIVDSPESKLLMEHLNSLPGAQ